MILEKNADMKAALESGAWDGLLRVQQSHLLSERRWLVIVTGTISCNELLTLLRSQMNSQVARSQEGKDTGKAEGMENCSEQQRTSRSERTVTLLCVRKETTAQA